MIKLGVRPVTSRPDVAYPPLACVAHVTSRPDLVAHPYPLARVALCCAPPIVVAG